MTSSVTLLPLLEFFNQIGKYGSEIATVFSVVITIIAGLLAISMEFFFSRSDRREPVEETRDPEKDSRLPELRHELSRQKAMARWSGRAAASLTVGQYIVGGVLASSFIQQALSAHIIGLLGLLVILSSLIHQRFRPDLVASGARRRTLLLRVLIRTIEDDIFAMKEKRPDAPNIFDLRRKASLGLAAIEQSELAETEQDNLDTQPNDRRVGTQPKHVAVDTQQKDATVTS
jgi:hypothetical protein